MRSFGLRNIEYRRRLLLIVAIGLPGALVAAPTGARAGESSQAYVAVASAASARLTWVVPGQFAVEEVADGGGPIAQSRLDAGSGESFASLPYPGGSAVAYQGLFNVATGVSSPFAYPFFVQAANPGQPKGDLADPSGAYRLHAEATGGSTGAVARFRPGAPEAAVSGGEAHTAITTSGATVTATAESVSEAVQLGDGRLRIASVRSRSVTTYGGGADGPQTQTSLLVDGLAAGDTRFGVGPDGLVVLGQPVPHTPQDAQALLDQILAPAGLSVRFVKAQALTGGGSAAALEIVSKQPQPQFPSSTVALRLGGAASAVALGERQLPPADVPAGVPVAPPAGGAETGAGGTLAPAVPDRPSPAGAVASAPLFRAPSGPPSAGAVFPAVPDEVAAGLGSAATAPAAAGGPVVGGDELAIQPIVRPRRVAATRWLYGLVGGAAALMLLLGGAVTKRGGAAWLDA